MMQKPPDDRFRIPIALGIVVVALLWLGWSLVSGHLLVKSLVDAPGVVREMQQLSELVTIRYSIQKIVGLKEEKIPLGSESILMIVQARVLAGIDLAAMREQDIVLGPKRSVSIKLPAAKIMHIYLDDKETKVWDRRITWWTPWVPFNPELEQKARLKAIESVQEEALTMGILKDARQNGENTIRALLRALGFESVMFLSTPLT